MIKIKILILNLIWFRVKSFKTSDFIQSEVAVSEKITNTINTIFNNSYSVVFISAENNLPNLKINLPSVMVKLYKNETLFLDQPKKFNNFFIHLDHIDTLPHFINNIVSSPSINTRGNFLILAKNILEPSHIFQEFWKNNIIHIILIQYTNTSSNIKTLLSSPYGDNKCGSLIKYIGAKEIHEKLFRIPTKLSGCSLTICKANITYVAMPYAGNPITPGILDTTTEIIGQALNISIIFEMMGKENELEIVSGNMEVYLKPSFDKCNLSLSLVRRYPMFYEWFDMSDIYFYDEYAWTIAKPKLMPNTEVLSAIFPLQIWICIAFAFMGSTIVIFPIARLSKSKLLLNPVFLMYSITISQVENKRRNMQKMYSFSILIQFYVFYAMYLNVIFQSGLSSILSKPYYLSGIKNVKEMANSDVIPVLASSLRAQFKTVDSLVIRKIYEKS